MNLIVASLPVYTDAREAGRLRPAGCVRELVQVIEPDQFVGGQTLIFSSADLSFLNDSKLKGFVLELSAHGKISRKEAKAGPPRISIGRALPSSMFETVVQRSARTGEYRVEFKVKSSAATKAHLRKDVLSSISRADRLEITLVNRDWQVFKSILEVRASAGSCAKAK